MAQVLKESQRQKILDAARMELLHYGYRDASMRRIATHAQMTAGNLYRYFSGKDELIRVITEPALIALDRIVRKLTDDKVTLGSSSFSVGLSMNDLQLRIDQFATDLADIAVDMPQELQILMLHSDLSDHLSGWLVHLFEILAEEWSLVSENPQQRHVLCRMFSVSLFQGVREVFNPDQPHPVTKEQISDVLRIYFHLFLSMFSPVMKGVQL